MQRQREAGWQGRAGGMDVRGPGAKTTPRTSPGGRTGELPALRRAGTADRPRSSSRGMPRTASAPRMGRSLGSSDLQGGMSSTSGGMRTRVDDSPLAQPMR